VKSLAIVVALAIALAACSSGRADLPQAVRRPGLHWDQFSDIPMPNGWQTLPGEDHVAIAIGNGAVRRLRVALIAPAGRSDLQPPEAMTRYVGTVLNQTGWTRDGDGRASDLSQHWRKGEETLDVVAERDGGLVVLRYRLAMPLVAP
jgi:hypothetical protein